MSARHWVVALLLLLLGVSTATDAAEVAIPPAPTAWVTDTAAFLMPQTVDTLDARLHAYETKTGHQILVYIVPTTGDTPTEEWTSRAFARWKVGRKSIDDGLVMFVFPTDRKVRIEVGYGLEQTVPDAVASRIIRNTVTPQIRAGKPDDAIGAGIDDILAIVGGEAAAPAAAPAADSGVTDTGGGADPLGVFIGVVIALVIVVVVIFLIGKLPRGRGAYISGRNSGFGLGDVLSIGGSLLSSGFSGGGGGFSGGGGGGGGGGATGSW